MLKGISSLFSPELLAALYRMGHGDEVVLADAHFPGHSVNSNVIRADGITIEDLLKAIMPLFVLDTYEDDPIVMMDCVPGDESDPTVESGYIRIIEQLGSNSPRISFIDRLQFYERAKKSFVVVMTGDTRKYANIILKKGVCVE
jgi:L-fucose mutarotase